MKRFSAFVLILLLISCALAEDMWYCVKCGTEVSSPFCPTCGGSREATGLRDGEWICVCGRVNRWRFCGKCGMSREDAAAEMTAEAEVQVIKNANTGDYVTYGRYPQTAEGTDRTPIEWLVLEKEGDTATLISRYALDQRKYHERLEPVTWETCDLRAWLNGDFIRTAYTEQEQRAIRTTHLRNPGHPMYDDIPGGSDTDDRVFLLSIDEVFRYFPIMEDGNGYGSKLSYRLIAEPTKYAAARKENTAVLTDAEIAKIEYYYAVRYPDSLSGTQACWWWLRSPGDYTNGFAFIEWYGHVYYDGGGCDDDMGGVRPVMVLQIPQQAPLQ